MSADVHLKTSAITGNNRMLNRDQFLEFFSLTNYRNYCQAEGDTRTFIFDQSSWVFLQSKLERHIGLSFPANPEFLYGAKIWDDLKKRTEICRLSNLSPSSYVCYETCSAIAQLAGIKSLREWYVRIPRDFRQYNLAIPGDPSKNYGEAWNGWGAFLGTQRLCTRDIAKTKWRYEDAKRYVRKYGISTVKEYRAFIKTPAADPRLPKRPDDFYADLGWQGWSNFLKPRFVSYAEAKKLMAPFGLRTESDFRKLGKKGRPAGVPSLPYVFYGDEFESWADFLGYTGTVNYQKRRSS